MDLAGVDHVTDLLIFGKRAMGITVGVGIAPTKTLAKLANHATKKFPATVL